MGESTAEKEGERKQEQRENLEVKSLDGVTGIFF